MPKDKPLKTKRDQQEQRPVVAPQDVPESSDPGGLLQISSLAELPVRGRIVHRGYVESMTILPPQQAPAFIVTIVDRPAPPGGRRSTVPHLHLVFVGQRRVPGVLAGSRLHYEGMVATIDSVPTIFNPRYEILPERTAEK